MEFLEKNKPKRLKDFIGNRIQINYFLEVLKKQDDESFKKKIILIIGPDGCGKTVLCNLIFNELNYNVLELRKDYTNKELMNLMTSFICNKSITSYFNKNRKKVIFIDNVDILLNTDRGIISLIEDMYKLLVQHNVILVITCKSNEEKKLIELKTKVEPIKINYPSIKESFAYLTIMIENYKKNESIPYDHILNLVNKYKGSIRDVILNLFNNDTEYTDTMSFKDMNQFEIISKLYKNFHNLNELNSLINDDMNTISFLLYENFPEEISNIYDLRSSKKGLLELYENMNDVYTSASILEEFIYRTMDWSLYDMIQMIKLFSINLIIHSLRKKVNIKTENYRYSQIMSKISHKNIMNKKVKNICVNNYDIDIMELITITDKIVKDKTIILSSGRKKKEKMYDTDECNFASTYLKYFIE